MGEGGEEWKKRKEMTNVFLPFFLSKEKKGKIVANSPTSVIQTVAFLSLFDAFSVAKRQC